MCQIGTSEDGTEDVCICCLALMSDPEMPHEANHAQWVADAEFIAHAREDIPAMTAQVRRDNAIFEEMARYLENWSKRASLGDKSEVITSFLNMIRGRRND